jgi:hypothetical protein
VSRRPAPVAGVRMAGSLLAIVVAIALPACGSGSGSSTGSTTSTAGRQAGGETSGTRSGPGGGPGAPPAARTSNPRPRQRHQGPPGSAMHSTYPGRILGHELATSGPVQPVELWPVTNAWRISDHRGLTAVYAGAKPDERSTGRLVVFRQNFIRVRQTSDRVDVPRSGPLTITSAPQGKSDQSKAQRDGTLQFKGANGTTGALHLSDDSVTVGSS